MTHSPAADPPKTRKDKSRAYHKTYWAAYRQRVRRIHGTLSPRDYAMISDIAARNGRTVWGQIWAESEAYRAGGHVPGAELEARIGQLHAELRRIGNNLNQLARTGNIFGRLKRPGEVAARLEELEQAVADFVARPLGVRAGGSPENAETSVSRGGLATQNTPPR